MRILLGKAHNRVGCYSLAASAKAHALSGCGLNVQSVAGYLKRLGKPFHHCLPKRCKLGPLRHNSVVGVVYCIPFLLHQVHDLFQEQHAVDFVLHSNLFS